VTGICGIRHLDGAPAAASDCARMQRALAIYGKDRKGQWDGGDVAFGIGLARLLPEDSHDRQPLSGGNGRFHLVADVRLDNRPELGAMLGLSPEQARRMADSDFVLMAWERWQQACLDKLVGDFAVAVWDAAERRLTLARDPFGQRPLFYHRTSDRIAFASMAKGLHALPDIPLAPDLATLRNHLALVPMRGRGSYFADIHRVEPGGLAVVHADGRVETSTWYELPLGRRLRLSDEEAIEAFRDSFERAVADRLRSTGGIASQLSGGLDSTAVTATAARLLGERGAALTAYTHVPLPDAALDQPERRFADEWAHAARLAAEQPNITHVRVDAADRRIGDSLDATFYYSEFPPYNLCNEVWIDEIERLCAATNAKVLLTGQMGNATISQDGLPYLPELWRGGRLIAWAREANALRRQGLRVRHLLNLTLTPLLPPALADGLTRARGRRLRQFSDYSALRPDVLASDEFGQHLRKYGLDPTLRPFASRRDAAAFVLQLVDFAATRKGALAASGVDTRDPTADRRLVELTLSLPSGMFLRQGQTKWIYHQAFADRVPPEIRHERARGYQGADWLARLRDQGDLVRAEAAQSLESPGAQALLDTPSLKRLLAAPAPEALDSVSRDKYRLKLLRSISAAHFIRKAQGYNPPPPEDVAAQER